MCYRLKDPTDKQSQIEELESDSDSDDGSNEHKLNYVYGWCIYYKFMINNETEIMDVDTEPLKYKEMDNVQLVKNSLDDVFKFGRTEIFTVLFVSTSTAKCIPYCVYLVDIRLWES